LETEDDAEDGLEVVGWEKEKEMVEERKVEDGMGWRWCE
jgi:hypothetical protein